MNYAIFQQLVLPPKGVLCLKFGGLYKSTPLNNLYGFLNSKIQNIISFYTEIFLHQLDKSISYFHFWEV